MSSFFKINKHKYIRNIISNNILCGKTIQGSLSFIEKEHNILGILNHSLFNITIQLEINSTEQFNHYLESPYRHIINSLVLDIDIEPKETSEFLDLLNEIPSQVTNLDISSKLSTLLPNTSFSKNTTLKNLLIDYEGQVKENCLPIGLQHLNIVTHGVPLAKEIFDQQKQLKSLDILVSSSWNQAFSQFNEKSSLEINVRMEFIASVVISELVNFKNLNITTLDLFNISFTICSPGDLPSSLTKLKMSSIGNLVEGFIPNGVKILTLYNFNRDFNSTHLPSSLYKLTLTRFSQPIRKGMIPDGLKILKLPFFSSILQHQSLPDSIEYLSLNSYTNAILPGLIPKSIKTLHLHSYTEQIRLGIIPNTCKQLSLLSYTGNLEEGVLPIGIESLTIRNGVLEPIYLPNTLTDMTILRYDESKSTNLLQHCKNLQKLYIISSIKSISAQIPNTVTHLSLAFNVESISESSIPSSVEILEIQSSKFDFQSIKNLTTIKTLKSKTYPSVLPKSLLNLIVDNKFQTF
ncbi:hypothetical protein CYY_007298 [Polysphondylium violaceum]|uniref:FNIP repeat-containing protein n=1 Tax=Polysphondylium violaceum TaxID=133409 RepID=A0A8J4PNW1_9MYCE|nr:hypothetical protein CYY_007298 [Polysphondylium violaceum]